MRFLIAKDFFKNIPKEKIEQVKSRIEYFYREISENKKTIFEAPKGFWVKKLRENLYEFRVNSGDRILFQFREIDRPGYNEKALVLLSFDKHDIVIVKGDRKNKEIIEIENLEIEKNNEVLEKNEISKEEVEKIYKRVTPKIIYEITSDKDLIELIKNEDEYTYYFLNNEQYDVLNEDFPLFLKGSAGSGKTTVAIRKVMELEEYGAEKVGYITFTHSLKEKAREMYEKFREVENEKVVQFLSLEELYEKLVKEKPVGIKIFEKFLYEFNPTIPKGLEPLELYQEIRGIIKGSMSLKGVENWDRDLNSKLIPKSDYLKLNKKYSIYSEESKEKIYEFAIKYQNWLDEKKYYDENDLARKVVLEKEPIFDYIICDEVQDLTEVEIYMLKNLVKDKISVFFAGDIHQIINPTYFRFSRVKTLFYKESGYKEKTLLKNYRSQKKIVDLANKLGNLRRTYIGRLGEDYNEKPILEGANIFISEKDEKFLKKLENNTTIILVASNESKKILRNEFPNIKNKILTVQDIKGLEFDSVVLYNFATELKNYWKKIFQYEAKNNQLYRYYFNLLYVGITRGKKRLLLMEENILDNPLLDNIKEFLTEFTIEGKRDFTLKSGEADFLKEGKELLSKELYQEAISAFEKAGAKKYIKIAKNELKASEYFTENGMEKTIKYIVENDDKLASTLEKYVVIDKIGDYAFDNKNYKKAKKYYEKSENFEKLADIYEKESNLEKSFEFAKKSENIELIKKIEKEIIQNNNAMQIAKYIVSLSDKNIGEKNISLEEFENLDRKYIKTKEKRNFNELQVILHGRFKNEIPKEKKIKLPSPTKLLIKLSYVKGSKKAINYILENYANKIDINRVVSLIDSGNIIEKYISNVKKDVNLEELLIKSCEKSKLENIKKLIQLGADIEITPEKGIKPIFVAIQNEKLEVLKILVENNVDLEASRVENSIKITPLVLAIRVGNLEIIDYLLQQNIDVNNNGPLFNAVRNEDYKTSKKLIELGAKINIKEANKNPLYEAIAKGNLKIAKLLLENGAELIFDEKITPLNILNLKENQWIFEFLLKNGYELGEKELEILRGINNFEISEVYLKHKYGENYTKNINELITPLIESREIEEEVKLDKEIEVKYKFEKYRVGVDKNGKD